MKTISFSELINELTYDNYSYNRRRAPDITPEQWSSIYNNTELLEARYQKEVIEENIIQQKQTID